MATSTVTVYTAEQVAEILRCNKETVYRWARKGLIGDGPLAGRRIYRFTDQHIEDFVSGKTKTAAASPKPSRHPKYAGK
jgi:excisionase family DNA binding protein